MFVLFLGLITEQSKEDEMSHDQSPEVVYEKASNERHEDINASIARHIDARFDNDDELYWMSQDLLRYG